MAPHRHGSKGVNSPYILPEAPHIGPAPGRHVSCQNCRKRKMKCSRTFPCVPCNLRDEDCEWQDAVPTRTTEALDLDHALVEITRLRSIVDDLAFRLSQSSRFTNLTDPPPPLPAPRFHPSHHQQPSFSSSIGTDTSYSSASPSPFPSFLEVSPRLYTYSPLEGNSPASFAFAGASGSLVSSPAAETGYPFAPDTPGTPPVGIVGDIEWGKESDVITEALQSWLARVPSA